MCYSLNEMGKVPNFHIKTISQALDKIMRGTTFLKQQLIILGQDIFSEVRKYTIYIHAHKQMHTEKIIKYYYI